MKIVRDTERARDRLWIRAMMLADLDINHIYAVLKKFNRIRPDKDEKK